MPTLPSLGERKFYLITTNLQLLSQGILLENFFSHITSADNPGWQKAYSVKTEFRVELLFT